MFREIVSILVVFSMIFIDLPISFSSPAGAMTPVNHGVITTYANASYYHYYGGAATSAGDVNGDGYDDFMMSDPHNNTGGTDRGLVFLMLGKSNGWAKGLNMSVASASWYGQTDNEELGSYIEPVGDVTGDGYNDVMIGNYLIFGKATGWKAQSNISTADVTIYGKNMTVDSGGNPLSLGDVNGDGLDDIALRAPGANSEGKTYLLFGRRSGWPTFMDLFKYMNASYVGENAQDQDFEIFGGGDVNGDHYNDFFVISEGIHNGKVYLVLGKKDGWTIGVDLANADATFVGPKNANLTTCANIVGDINGDGIDDFIIVTPYDGSSPQGHAYLFFGQNDGWKKDVSYTTSNASFKSESGSYISDADHIGDVNGDGIDDLVLSHRYNDGYVYLFLGKKDNWGINVSTSTAYSSYISPESVFGLGHRVSGGDLNRDGTNDLVISATGGGDDLYFPTDFVIFGENASPPSIIDSLKVYSGSDYLKEINNSTMGSTIYIEVIGNDSNPSRTDLILVNISSNVSSPVGYPLMLRETGQNTGQYRGNFTLMNRTLKDKSWLRSAPFEKVKITSYADNTKSKSVLVGNIWIKGKLKNTIVQEDQSFNASFTNENGTTTIWDFKSNATWLAWNGTNHNLSGVPSNRDVGWYYVNITIKDAYGYRDFNNFSLKVINTPPAFTTQNVQNASQNVYYSVDYNSTDDDSFMVTYHLATNATWLKISAPFGVLSGTPKSDNVGVFWVNVSADDGNGGWAYTNFTLGVNNVNDPPKIQTIDVKSVTENHLYYLKYYATDPDSYDTNLKWSITTDAKWLHVNNATAELNGTPMNDDVGTYQVNVIVEDSFHATDSHAFILTVINVNDPPVWTEVPVDISILEGTTFQTKIKAVDVDLGSKLYYNIQSIPWTNITIGHLNGSIKWATPVVGKYLINVSVSDTTFTIYHIFNLTVLKLAGTPKASLIYPKDKEMLNIQDPTFKWNLTQDGNNTLWSDFYIGKNLTEVSQFSIYTHLGTNLETNHYTTNITFEKESIYYWTVIPHSTEQVGLCLDGIWSFSIAKATIANSPPTITSNAPLLAIVGTEYLYDVNATDSDHNDSLIYNLTQKPADMTIDPISGLIRWIPLRSQTGIQKVSVEVSDGKVSIFQDFSINVIYIPLKWNHPPTLSPISNQTINVEQTFQYQINATDPDAEDRLTFVLSDNPAGMFISSSGLIVWTPTSDQVGVHIITINVTDGKNSTSFQFKIEVKSTAKSDHNNGLTWMISMALLIIIVIIIAALIVIIIHRKKKKVE
jgi:hypothetical protein